MMASPIITPGLMRAIRRTPGLPKDTWYYVTGTTLSVLNRPNEIPGVYRHALEFGGDAHDCLPSDEDKLSISRRLREALIKAAPIGGLPKTINALTTLKGATPDNLLDLPGTSVTNRRTEITSGNPVDILARGQSFWDSTYGKVAERIQGNLDSCGTEDLGMLARLLYGYVFSNTSVLSPEETSYVLLAALIPQDVNPQLKGHLKGTLNGGATLGNVRAVRSVVLEVCKAAGMKMLDGQEAGLGWREVPATV